MRNLLIAVALLFSSTVYAEPEWKSKPVQCASVTEVYKEYVWKYKLKPIFLGVATVPDGNLNATEVAVAFYLSEDGIWMLVELGRDTCVVSMGNSFDPNIDEKRLNETIFGKNNT